MGWTSGFPVIMEPSSADAFEMTYSIILFERKDIIYYYLRYFFPIKMYDIGPSGSSQL